MIPHWEEDRRLEVVIDQIAGAETHLNCNLAALQHTECCYREILAVEPSDMAVRVELAWCLFMQCLYLAGKEAAIQPDAGAADRPGRRFLRLSRQALSAVPQDQPAETSAPLLSPAVPPHAGEPTADLAHLLGECGRQITIVTQLSADPGDRMDIMSLTALVQLAFGPHALTRVQHTASRILAQLSRDILRSSADPHPS